MCPVVCRPCLEAGDVQLAGGDPGRERGPVIGAVGLEAEHVDAGEGAGAR